MEEEKNSITYMGLVLRPNKADDICGKTMYRERCNEVPLYFISTLTMEQLIVQNVGNGS
jgi:hypothetical protein